MKLSNLVGTLALSAICVAGPIAGTAVAQPAAGDQGGPAAEGQRGQRGQRGAGGQGGQRGQRGGGMQIRSQDVQAIFGADLTQAQKTQLTTSVEARDKAIETANQQFLQQLMQVTGLNEEQIRTKTREHMQQRGGNRPGGGPREGRQGGRQPRPEGDAQQ